MMSLRIISNLILGTVSPQPSNTLCLAFKSIQKLLFISFNTRHSSYPLLIHIELISDDQMNYKCTYFLKYNWLNDQDKQIVSPSEIRS